MKPLLLPLAALVGWYAPPDLALLLAGAGLTAALVVLWLGAEWWAANWQAARIAVRQVLGV